jgi:hypothetical protein
LPLFLQEIARWFEIFDYLFANIFALGLSLKIVFSMLPLKTQCSNGFHIHPLLYVFFIQVVLMIFMFIPFFGVFLVSSFLMAFILVLLFVSFNLGYFESICPCPFLFCLHDIHLALMVFVFSGILKYMLTIYILKYCFLILLNPSQ